MHLFIGLRVVIACDTFCDDIIKQMRQQMFFWKIPILVGFRV
jgi:hypothetical protein